MFVGVGGPGGVGGEGGGAQVERDAGGGVGGVEGVVLGCCEGVSLFRAVVGGFVFGHDEVEVCFDFERLWCTRDDFSKFLLGTELLVDGSEGWVWSFCVAEGEVDGSGTPADGHLVCVCPNRGSSK